MMRDDDLDDMTLGQLRAECQRLRGLGRRNGEKYKALQRAARLEQTERRRLARAIETLERNATDPMSGLDLAAILRGAR